MQHAFVTIKKHNRGRGRTRTRSKPSNKEVSFPVGTDQIHSIIPSSELVNLINSMLMVKEKQNKKRPKAI